MATARVDEYIGSCVLLIIYIWLYSWSGLGNGPSLFWSKFLLRALDSIKKVIDITRAIAVNAMIFL